MAPSLYKKALAHKAIQNSCHPEGSAVVKLFMMEVGTWSG